MEKETAELIAHLNDEVVPVVRQHSTKALRIAAEKLLNLADYMENRPSAQVSAYLRGNLNRPLILLFVSLFSCSCSLAAGEKKNAKRRRR